MIGKKLVVLVITCGVLLSLLAPAAAQDTNPTSDPAADTTAEVSPVTPTRTPLVATTDLFVTSPFRVNVRSGPGTAYTIIDVLTPADGLDITGQSADADWLRVNFNGQEGWVFTGVVDVDGAVENAPVVEAGATAVLLLDMDTGAPTVVEDSGDVVVMTRFNSNLRTSFSTEADILEMIPFNTELLPEGRTENSSWLMVTFDDQSGWVYAPILFFASGQVETLPIMGTNTDG